MLQQVKNLVSKYPKLQRDPFSESSENQSSLDEATCLNALKHYSQEWPWNVHLGKHNDLV